MKTNSAIEALDKRIASNIRFKDRMIEINDGLKEGKSENELEMSVFEIEIRAQDGNFRWIKREDGRFVKLFSWDLIKRTIDKVKSLREEKAQMCASVSTAAQ